MIDPTVAVIPSRYEPDRLRALVEVVLPDVDLLVVVDTGHDGLELPAGPIVVLREDPDASIYRWWNAGWRAARSVSGIVNVAYLNDDVVILPGTVRMLAKALRSRPDLGAVYPDARVRTSDAPGLPRRVALEIERDPLCGREMTGYCFVARGELPLDPPFDEGYRWWFGDTQFDEVVRLLGYGVARVNRVPVDHSSDAERDGWSRRPELRDLVEEDGRRFDLLHREVREGAWWPIAEQYRRFRRGSSSLSRVETTEATGTSSGAGLAPDGSGTSRTGR